jgi:hypothetical protein
MTMKKFLLTAFIATVAVAVPASADTPASLAAGKQSRIDAEPVFSPILTRLISTKLRYVGEGAPEIYVPAMQRTNMPGLAGKIACPGKSSCYLEAVVEAQVFNLTGAMGFDVIVDGNGLDSAIGSVHVFGANNYEMAQRRFMVEVPPGMHSIKVQTFGTEGFSFVRHAATYKMYKK